MQFKRGERLSSSCPSKPAEAHRWEDGSVRFRRWGATPEAERNGENGAPSLKRDGREPGLYRSGSNRRAVSYVAAAAAG